ncbi:hypothetical protein DPX16_14674 [Anabarilius grahami]|uniref:Uncharacterized protein n=1 Tax=Anabarilius grahami TaxID=495550 RepID=A0A3N0XRG5_ANAGA|nr:hypothetical protein DPX16_14674 [Anabarilius grahami]
MLVSGKTRSGAAASGETEAYIAQTQKMASAVTVSAIDSGRTSETLRLDTTAEIPAACTDISIVSTKLDAHLTRIETTLMASQALEWQPCCEEALEWQPCCEETLVLGTPDWKALRALELPWIKAGSAGDCDGPTTAKIPAACTDISDVSAKLEDSLTRIETTLMASCATFMPARNSGWRLWHGGHVEKRL